jgi:hypothetical protein
MPTPNTNKPLSNRVINKFLEHCMRGKEDECWIWTGPMHATRGYGIFEVYGIEYKAHRVSFFYFNKRTEESEMDILHTCDNRRCCNPKHLYEGSNLENMRDRRKRNPESYRQLLGSINPAAKITENDIPEIFKLKKAGYTQEQIAYKYDVVFSTIGKILRREMWSHVKIDK